MRLRAVEVRGALWPEGRRLTFLGPRGAARVVALRGGSGAGKSWLLRVLVFAKEAIGAYGARPGAEAPPCEVRMEWELSAAEAVRAGTAEVVRASVQLGGARSVTAPEGLAALLSSYRHGPEPKLEWFPEQRQLLPSRALPPSAWTRGDEEERLLRPTARFDKYLGLRGWLVQQELADLTALAAEARTRGVVLGARPSLRARLNQRLQRLDPGLALAAVEPDPVGPRVLFARRRGPNAPPGSVELDELSASEQDAVLLAGTCERIGLTGSIVLLDRPELHVGPSRQAAWFDGLVNLEPSAQLLLATSSPSVAERAEVVVDLEAP